MTTLIPPVPPCHVGLIMDGNGRWASQRGQPRTEGHKAGLVAAKKTVLAASQAGVRYLSLYTFSTENWRRTADEVGFLMNMIPSYLKKEAAFYHRHGIRLIHSGNRVGLSGRVLDALDEAMAMTAGNEGLTVNLAINYGGRDEIIRAIQRLQATPMPAVDEDSFSSLLDNAGLPDLDLVIRTGGEQRLSNFFIWQSAYAELYFSDILWPDWTPADFIAALENFGTRQRRYGGCT